MATTAAELQVKTTLNDQASKKVEGMGLSLGKLTAAVGLGTLAASAFQKATSFVTETIKGSIAAAEAEQVSQGKVNAILKTLTGSFEEHSKVVEEASRAAMQLGFDDEDAAESMAKLLQVTGDTTQANVAFQDAMDLARFKGIALQDATMAVNLALQGNTRVLKQLGVDVPDNASKMELLGLVHDRVAGQAKNYGDSAAGAQDRFKVALENLQEHIGGRVLPVITSLFNTISAFVSSEQFSAWIDKVFDGFQRFGNFLQTIIPIIRETFVNAFEQMSSKIKAFGTDIGALDWLKRTIDEIAMLIKVDLKPAWDEFLVALQPFLPVLKDIGKYLLIVTGATVLGGLLVLVKVFEGLIETVKILLGLLTQMLNTLHDIGKAIGTPSSGGYLGSLADLIKGRAAGGPVTAGVPYMVGEEGPEWFVPKQSGNILPNGSGANVSINFNNPTVRSDNDLSVIVQTVRTVMARQLQLAKLGA